MTPRGLCPHTSDTSEDPRGRSGFSLRGWFSVTAASAPLPPCEAHPFSPAQRPRGIVTVTCLLPTPTLCVSRLRGGAENRMRVGSGWETEDDQAAGWHTYPPHPTPDPRHPDSLSAQQGTGWGPEGPEALPPHHWEGCWQRDPSVTTGKGDENQNSSQREDTVYRATFSRRCRN